MTVLGHSVYFIGGSSCSGKSSIAKAIAEKSNLVLYRTDDHAFGKHMFELADTHDRPSTEKYRRQLCAGVDAFIRADTDTLYRAFIDFCHEVYPFLMKDIGELSKKGGVIVEGTHILPELLHDESKKNQYIFLISTEDQQRRLWLMEMSKEAAGGNEYEINDYMRTDDKRAFENARVGLHQRIAEHIKNEAIRNDMDYAIVDRDTPLSRVQATVERHFSI